MQESLKVYKVSDFGGLCGKEHLNTQAIQETIEACYKAGGGIVQLTEGLWLSGPIELKSGVTLELLKGAILKADNRKGDFVNAYIGHPFAKNEAFIFANDAQNISLKGEGGIDGSGAENWWDEAIKVREAVRAGNGALFEKRFPNVKLANGMPRPWLIEFNKVQEASLEGLSLCNSPMWNVVLRDCAKVKIEKVKIDAPEYSPNTDGIDIVSSSEIHINEVLIHTGDDNISIKSGVNQDNSKPSDKILIENSVMLSGHGISVGSETANGIGQVEVLKVKFKDGENGVRIKSARDRGNKIGPLIVDKVEMDNVQTPILVTLTYAGQSGAAGLGLVDPLDKEEISATTPYVKGVRITNFKAQNANIAALLSGLPESHVLEVYFENVEIESKLGIQARYVEGTLVNTHVLAKEGEGLVRGPEAYLKEAR